MTTTYSIDHDYASDIVSILGRAVAEVRRLTPGDYRAGATETLDNLLYPFARHLSRTVGGLRQDVNRIAAQIDRKDLGSDHER